MTYLMNKGSLNRRGDAALDDDWGRKGSRDRNMDFDRNRHFHWDGHGDFHDLANLLVRGADRHGHGHGDFHDFANPLVRGTDRHGLRHRVDAREALNGADVVVVVMNGRRSGTRLDVTCNRAERLDVGIV